MHLLRRIEIYLRRSGTAASSFGRNAAGDPCLVQDIRNGREPRPATAQRLAAYLDRVEESVGK